MLGVVVLEQTGKGFKLRSSTGPIRRLSLKAGAEGKAAIDVVATNALPVPGLPLTPPVTIQLKAVDFAPPGQPTVDALGRDVQHARAERREEAEGAGATEDLLAAARAARS